nr:hypothetical protein [Bacteroidota bacterium]
MNTIKLLKLTSFIFAFFLLATTFSFAQDMIYQTNGDVIKAKIIEIKEYEISYKEFDYQDGPIINIKTRDIRKIIFNNGRKMTFNDDPYEVGVQEMKNREMQQAIKIDIMSPLTGNLTLGYERVIKVGLNVEGSIGIIGAGVHSPKKQNLFGGFLRMGPKLLSTSNLLTTGTKRLHALGGTYMKPTITIGSYHYDRDVYYAYYDANFDYVSDSTLERVTRNYATIDIIFGGQGVTAGRFVIDYYFGIGYGFVKTKYKLKKDIGAGSIDNSFGEIAISDDVLANLYSDIYVSKTIPLTFTCGLQIGYIFK